MNYYTLMASLPNLPVHFDVELPPISRPGLEQRLSLLDEQDSQILQQLTDFLAWDRQPMDRTDQQVVAEYNRLKEEIKHPLIIQIVEHRINIRTIVSAIRRRRDGHGPPVGVGQLVDAIRRGWQLPQFGLQRRYPWIEDFEVNVAAGEAVEAERILFEFSWKTWCRMAAEFTFSFEAVLLYLARWSIVDRWTSRDTEAGRVRFEKLIEETLGEYARLKY